MDAPDEGYSRDVSKLDAMSLLISSIYTMDAPDEGYSRDVS